MARKRKRYDEGGEITVTAPRDNRISNWELPAGRSPLAGLGPNIPQEAVRDMDGGTGGNMPQPGRRDGLRVQGVRTAVGKLPGVTYTQGNTSFGVGASPAKGGAIGARLRTGFKEGGSIKKKTGGGKVSSASKRADGCATKGKTRGRMV